MSRLSMRRSVRFASLGMAGFLAACATAPTGPVPSTNLAAGVAVKGYDPVAYVTDGKPVEGSDKFQTRWQGATYHFASADNRDRFVEDPEKYAPQYGGFCAFAAAHETIADIDPSDWAVVDGKLYLNNNDLVQTLWSVDKTGNIASGNHYWTGLDKQPVPQ